MREAPFPATRLGERDVHGYDGFMMNQVMNVREVAIRDSFACLEFDDFRLFPRRRLLMRRDDVVRIGGRGFDLLTLLACRAGDIVAHNELIKGAWPNRVISDCNLKVQIASLQKILGEAPCGGRYIKCVALRGYVFVADVRLSSSMNMDQSTTLRWTYSPPMLALAEILP